MIEPIEQMPPGTIGLRSAGKLSREDYTQVLEPALARAVEAGEIRLLVEIAAFDGLEPGAWIEDAKTGIGTWVKHHSAWKRFALVTDVDWIAKAVRGFSWLAPGEVKIFAPAELGDAKAWVAEGG